MRMFIGHARTKFTTDSLVPVTSVCIHNAHQLKIINESTAKQSIGRDDYQKLMGKVISGINLLKVKLN